MDANISRVCTVLSRLVSIRDVPEIPQATDDEMRLFENETQISVPNELRAWLRICNGAELGTDGPYGVRSSPEHLSIKHVLKIHPEIHRLRWLPLAGDGCGDYYVLDTTTLRFGCHPVYFIDHEVSIAQADYVVASNIWDFLYGYLQDECAQALGEETSWPFDPDELLERDPNLIAMKDLASLPWED